MTYKTITVTPPTVEPVTVDESYNQLRLSAGDDDDHVAMLVKIARDKAEKYCNRFFTEQTIKIVFDGDFNPLKIDLPYPDLASVVSITYVDSSNSVVAIPVSDYTLFPDEQVIYPASSFPSGAKSHTVQLTTGVPAEYNSAKMGILMLLTDLYELRTESVVGTIVSDNPAVVASLWQYRVNLSV